MLFLRNLLTLYFLSVNKDKGQAALQSHYPKSLTDAVLDAKPKNPAALITLLRRFFDEEGYFKTPLYSSLITIVFDYLDTHPAPHSPGYIDDHLTLRVDFSDKLLEQLLHLMNLRVKDPNYHKFTSPNLGKFVYLEWANLSSGQKGFLDLFSRFESVKTKLPRNADHVLIFIDEGEAGFHPAWQIQFIKTLLHYFTHSYAHYHLQLLLATHSPLVLSDLPKERVHLFKRATGKQASLVEKVPSFGTFAQNVSTLLAQEFFIDTSLIGALALEYINQLLTRIHNLEPASGSRHVVELTSAIERIDEPVIRKLLLNELSHRINA